MYDDNPNESRIIVVVETDDYSVRPETVEALEKIPGLIEWYVE